MCCGARPLLSALHCASRVGSRFVGIGAAPLESGKVPARDVFSAGPLSDPAMTSFVGRAIIPPGMLSMHSSFFSEVTVFDSHTPASRDRSKPLNLSSNTASIALKTQNASSGWMRELSSINPSYSITHFDPSLLHSSNSRVELLRPS